jgi:GntR family transcriptional regulator
MEEQGDEKSTYYLDHNSLIPYYLQVKNALIKQIRDGKWKEGEMMPGEDCLIERFGVSRAVIRQALGEMVHEGFVIRKRGKGTFIAARDILRQQTFSTLEALVGILHEQKMITKAHVLEQQILPASSIVATQLRIGPMTPVIRLIRLWQIREEATFLLMDHLPYESFPNAVYADLAAEFLLNYLKREYGLEIENGRCFFSSGAATAYEADLLKTQPNAPVMKLRSIGYAANGRPVLFSHGLLRSDGLWIEGQLLGAKDMQSSSEA